MAIFNDPWEENALDWCIMLNSPIARYHRIEVLEEDIAWFRGRGYTIHEFDCTTWTSERTFHNDVAATLRFPDYYGKNLDAFNDCVSDLDISNESGMLLVFRQYDAVLGEDAQLANCILDILATQSRFFSLQGLRLIALVQVDDATVSFEPVGRCTVEWNPREWLRK